MPIGTHPVYNSTSKTLPVLGTTYNQDLHIQIDVGRLYIPPRNASLEGRVAQSVIDNNYHPNPGGEQGKSFVNPDVRQIISESLVSCGHGVMPLHIEIKGAPYCTFLDVSMGPNEDHPYYDFIKSPLDLGDLYYSTSLVFNLNQPVPDPFSQGTGANVPQNPQYLGPVNIPATSFTEPEVKKLKSTGELITLTSYNYWTVSNVVGSNFNIKKYLGYEIKNSSTVANAQPYAYVNNDNETSSIVVVASNSIVVLNRKYPIWQDIAHQSGSKYYYLNNSQGANELSTQYINLYNGTTPVGFTLKFDNIVTVGSQNTFHSVDGQVFGKQPEIWIQWGDFNFMSSESARNKYAQSKTVGLYTLYFNSTDPARLFFNKSDTKITSNTVNPLSNSIILDKMPKINVGGQSNEKTPSQFEVYVFYSAQYMYVGSSSNPHEWQQIGKPRIQYANIGGGDEFKHHLDSDSQIQIVAKMCNFVFKYGPPLFTPVDKNNIPELTTQEPINQRNYFSNNQVAPNKSLEDIADANTSIPEFILNNALYTFQDADATRYINASAYIDKRSVNPYFPTAVEKNPQDAGNSSVFFKITMPFDLGGHVFNKFNNAPVIQEPDITKSYVQYDVSFSKSTKKVSDILTQSLVEADVTKNIEKDGASITGSLNFTFINLNRTEEGYSLLQWMRNNIAVLRLKAGFGDDTYIWGEGVVTEVTVEESLDQTTIIVKTDDPFSYLFKQSKSMIISRTGFSFPGMRFQDIINSLVDRTELQNHFKYDLGATLEPFFKYSDKASLPSILDTMLIPNLAQLRVIPYSTQESYFKVLQTICQLTLVSPLIENSDKGKSDVAIMYWYAGEQGEGLPIDGIKFSSRFDDTDNKDKDIFYFRKKNIDSDLTLEITKLHGYLIGSEGEGFSFQSSSNTQNLFYEGIYFYQDYQQRQEIVTVPIDKVDITSLEFFEPKVDGIQEGPYIGYDKIILFSDESKPGDAAQVNSLLLPKDSTAKNRIATLYNYFCATPYETISLKAYVSKPLKHWGHFSIAVESDDPISERYLYSEISYKFKIFENLITADIKGSRNPVVDQS
jgi:hypothetical protein